MSQPPKGLQGEVQPSDDGVIAPVADLKTENFKFFGLEIPITNVGGNAIGNGRLYASAQLEGNAALLHGQDGQLFDSGGSVPIPYPSKGVGFELGHLNREGVAGIRHDGDGFMVDVDLAAKDGNIALSEGYVCFDPKTGDGLYIGPDDTAQHVASAVVDEGVVGKVSPVDAAVYTYRGVGFHRIGTRRDDGSKREDESGQSRQEVFHGDPHGLGMEGAVDDRAGETTPTLVVNQGGDMFWFSITAALTLIVAICVIFALLAIAIAGERPPLRSPERMADDPAFSTIGYRGTIPEEGL